MTFTHPNGADITVPERSFIRVAVDAKQKQIRTTIKKLQGQVLEGFMSQRQALETVGLFVQGLIRSRISQGIPPPLRPATIRRKGSSKPLIATGQLRASIDYETKDA